MPLAAVILDENVARLASSTCATGTIDRELCPSLQEPWSPKKVYRLIAFTI
jgi:hypothetical protein